MLKNFFRKRIEQNEKLMNYDMTYLKHLLEATTSGFIKFSMFMPLSRHRRAASNEERAVAQIVASKSEDCGPCVQLVVNMNLAQGVSSNIIQAVLDDRPQQLPKNLASIYAYADAVCRHLPEASELAEMLEAERGRVVQTDLALAIAAGRVFPCLKRGLGYAKSCAIVKVKVA